MFTSLYQQLNLLVDYDEPLKQRKCRNGYFPGRSTVVLIDQINNHHSRKFTYFEIQIYTRINIEIPKRKLHHQNLYFGSYDVKKL